MEEKTDAETMCFGAAPKYIFQHSEKKQRLRATPRFNAV
jgi:hypothetical protein